MLSNGSFNRSLNNFLDQQRRCPTDLDGRLHESVQADQGLSLGPGLEPLRQVERAVRLWKIILLRSLFSFLLISLRVTGCLSVKVWIIC